MPRRTPSRLHVGVDAEKTVVALRPVRLRAGRARTRPLGMIAESTPVEGTGRTPAQRIVAAARLGAVSFLLIMVLDRLGIAWTVPTAVAALTLGQYVRAQARSAATGVFALPRSADAAHVLVAAADRETFARCLATAHRIRATWPALGDMIDPVQADLLLSRALWDLATVLGRRQEIRRIRDELYAARVDGLPADSPAVRALAEQRGEVERLWDDVNTDVRRHAETLVAAAAAGESLIREQQVGRTARDAQLLVAQLTAARYTGGQPIEIAGQDLAERTAAVAAAYRDLAARYGTD
jgi:hypothetical protein